MKAQVVEILTDSNQRARAWEARPGKWSWSHPNGSEGIDCESLEAAEAAIRESEKSWHSILNLINAAPDLLAACEHAAQSCHHPACKCKGEYSAFPEQYCACHVQKARAAIAKAKGEV